MRKTAFAFLLALSLVSCKQDRQKTRVTVEEAARLQSSIEAGDAAVAEQFVSGLYGAEGNPWRWTQREFTIALAAPVGSEKRGAVLALKLTVPPVVIEKVTTITLTASIGGRDLAPETFGKPGQYTYQRPVAPDQLTGRKILVNFGLDKSIQAPPDIRELGVIVSSAALQVN